MKYSKSLGKNTNLIKTFGYAFNGILLAIDKERNFRIHLVFTCYVLYFSTFYNFSVTDYAILLILCACVISFEMINTAIEDVINIGVQNYDVRAKRAKDISAGAVLVFAVVSVIIGALLFFDIAVLKNIWYYYTANIWRAPILILSLIVSGLFIFKNTGRAK